MMRSDVSPDESAVDDVLTVRERDVIRLLAAGKVEPGDRQRTLHQ